MNDPLGFNWLCGHPLRVVHLTVFFMFLDQPFNIFFTLLFYLCGYFLVLELT